MTTPELKPGEMAADRSYYRTRSGVLVRMARYPDPPGEAKCRSCALHHEKDVYGNTECSLFPVHPREGTYCSQRKERWVKAARILPNGLEIGI